MIWLLAKKDFLLNLFSVRFLIGFMLCLFVIPFSMIVSVDSYTEQLAVYNIEKEVAEKELAEIRVYGELQPEIVKAPEPLSIFSIGVTENIGNKVKINIYERPLFPTGHASTRDNPLLNTFFSLDFIRIIALLISLIALVFSYDSITREREEGTLKLMLTGRVSRITFLFGKLLGLLITLLPILIFCYLLACLIILINPDIAFTTTEWAGILMLFATSLVYMMVFLLIGMFISSLVKNSSVSIILNLLCWIWFLFLVPALSSYISQSLVKIPLYDNVEGMIEQHIKQYNSDYNDKQGELMDKMGIKGYNFQNYSQYNFQFIRIVGTSAEMLECMRQLGHYRFYRLLELADQNWSVQAGYQEGLLTQAYMQQRLGWLSPAGLFSQSSMEICRTGTNAFRQYMQSLRDYREVYIRYFEDRKIPESIEFTSSLKASVHLPQAEIDAMEDDDFGKYFHSLGDDAYIIPDLSEFPYYSPVTPTLSGVFKQGLNKIVVFLGLVLVLLLATSLSFMRFDVR